MAFEFNSQPKNSLTRIHLYGDANTGKTYAAAHMTDRTVFISTDGNAVGQYPGQTLKWHAWNGKMDVQTFYIKQLNAMIDKLEKERDSWDALAIDLIDKFETDLLVDLPSSHTQGQIVEGTGIVMGANKPQYDDYSAIQTFGAILGRLLNNKFPDKIIIFISREKAVESASGRVSFVPFSREQFAKHWNYNIQMVVRTTDDFEMVIKGGVKFDPELEFENEAQAKAWKYIEEHLI